MPKFIEKSTHRAWVNLDLVAHADLVPAPTDEEPGRELVFLATADGASLGYCNPQTFQRAMDSSPVHRVANVLRGIEESLDAITSRLEPLGKTQLCLEDIEVALRYLGKALDRIEAQMNEAGRVHDEERLDRLA